MYTFPVINLVSKFRHNSSKFKFHYSLRNVYARAGSQTADWSYVLYVFVNLAIFLFLRFLFLLDLSDVLLNSVMRFKMMQMT